ncbi:uncharacterized protein K02A2.6-like [Eupeodes corollae]|uniref:uncharacterized protein K02A2.6-like n=1 Tax=Eupeodes corollae TaxID=290404 RepID=UPI002491DCFF|nr:uncharacterized protein K02A2.6-like [Eupeodes corollae]
MDKATLEAILKSQNDWMAQILEAQKSWMETNTRGTVVGSSGMSVVQPFPAYKKDENWKTYLKQLEQHFEACGVSEDKQKRAFFLSWIGSDNFETLQKLYGGEDLSTKSFKELTEKLSEHLVSKIHVLAARYQFHKTSMKPGQTYADWVADLRGVARNCKFSCPKETCSESYVDNMIRDIIVLYTPHDTVRTQALQKIDPELKDVLDIATAYETTQKTFSAIKENNNEMEVNALSTSKGCSQSRTQSDSARKSCPSCFVNHQRSDCRHNKTVCHKCKKIGHIAAVCLMSVNDGNASTVNSKRNKKHKSNRRDKIKSSGKYTANSIEQIHFSEVVASHECAMVKAESRPWIMVDVVVNGCPMRFQVDTGASCSLVGLEGFQKLGQPKRCATTKSLQAYGGTPLRLKGELAVQVTYENSTHNMNLLVVDGSGANILGLDWFKAFSLKVQHSILQIKSNDFLLNSIETLCKKYGRLFSSGLGKCTSFQAHLELKDGAVPKFVRHRQIPYALLDGTKKELDRLVAEGILSWVQRTQWAAPVVIVEKANGGIRICGDFKTTVNPQIVCNRHPLPRPRDLFHMAYVPLISRGEHQDFVIQNKVLMSK